MSDIVQQSFHAELMEITMQRHSLLHQLAVGAFLILFSACSNWAPVECREGPVCPPAHVCSVDGKTCIPQKAPCGNGIIDKGETCDDGNVESEGICSWNCKAATDCGNGVIDEDEMCDPADNSDCWPDCQTLNTCGNSRLDLNEECEDKPNSSDDSCVNCQLRWCGNGRKDPGEVCDPALSVCSGDCASDLTCGNGIIDEQRDEVCDDENQTSGDGCSADCKVKEYCGNGRRDHGEQCDCGAPGVGSDDERCLDEPNSLSSGFCRPDCMAHCGDDELNQQEREQTCDGEGPILHSFCTTKGFEMGLLACNQCQLDSTPCGDHVDWHAVESPVDPSSDSVVEGLWIDNSTVSHSFTRDRKVYVVDNINISAPDWEDMRPIRSNEEWRLTDLWRDLNNIYVTGYDGNVWNYNEGDRDWKKENIPWPYDGKDLFALWGFNPLVYAVGENGTIIRYNGTAWQVVPSTTNSPNSHLIDVWGTKISQEDLQVFTFFAVGHEGTIVHSTEQENTPINDIEWKIVASGTKVRLTGIWGTQHSGRLYLFAVGDAGTILHCELSGSMLAMACSDHSFPTKYNLYGVWGTSKDNVYAVGDHGMILHYAGGSWTPVLPKDTGFRGNSNFRSVWAFDSRTIFFVSEGGGLHRLIVTN